MSSVERRRMKRQPNERRLESAYIEIVLHSKKFFYFIFFSVFVRVELYTDIVQLFHRTSSFFHHHLHHQQLLCLFAWVPTCRLLLLLPLLYVNLLLLYFIRDKIDFCISILPYGCFSVVLHKFYTRIDRIQQKIVSHLSGIIGKSKGIRGSWVITWNLYQNIRIST